MKESFKPIKNKAPLGLKGSLLFYIRFIFDLQNWTIYSSLRKYLKGKNGAVLDVGCGDSPYRHLLNSSCTYTGIDKKDQSKFGYERNDIIYFKDNKIPLENSSIDLIMCTEVIEHLERPAEMAAEIQRVLKEKGTAFITIPWSARYHYVPYDYGRYTPSAIQLLFADFASVEIEARGTDLTSICSKTIVLCARNIIPSNIIRWFALPLTAIFFGPIMFLAALIGHLSVILKAGSTDDPLGYTVYIIK